MIKISYWARRNKRVAQLIIISSYAMVTLLAVFSGRLLAGIGIEIHPSVFYIAALAFSWIFIRYPYRGGLDNVQSWRSSFVKRKMYDVIAVLTGYLMIIQVANHYSLNADSAIQVAGVSVAYGLDPLPFMKKGPYSKVSSDAIGGNHLREKKARIKSNLELIKKLDKSDGTKAALALLTVVGGIALLVLIALLSCEISCSGAETLGMIVLIGGSALVILTATMIILRIYKGKRVKPKKNQQPAPLSSN